MSKFSQRSYEKEQMDDLACSGEELGQTLHELKTVNKWLGGNQVTTSGLTYFIRERPQESYKIADIGCGGGDMIRVMFDWSKNQEASFSFEGIDANPNIITLARRRNPLPQTKYVAQNIFDESFTNEKVDISTCTLFTHHFTDSELVTLLKALKSKSELGLIINDLHRHPLAYYSIKWITYFFSNSSMVKNDAPLSVLRAFTRKDWVRIFEAAEIKNFSIKWNWAFRWQVYALF